MARLIPYEAPSWASKLKSIPGYTVKLAQKPTPIEKWCLPGLPSSFQLSVKRDDLTGSTLTGNKVRKLEFLLADAIDKGCDSIITCGGIQSNHCRATAVSSRQLGLKCHLLLQSKEREKDLDNTVGNVAVDRLVGADVYLVPNESLEGGLWERVTKLGNSLRDERKENAYLVPLGGSSSVGTFGYIEAFQEMINQNVLQDFDDIVMAIGSGGTAAGITVGNYLTGSKLRIHAVCVCDDAVYFYKHIQNALEEYGLGGLKAQDLIDLIDGYKGRGYAMSTEEELEFLVNISQETGILVDPTYNLKAIRGMLSEMKMSPSRFKGTRILYLHTGGVFSIFDGRVTPTLLDQTKSGKQSVKIWNDRNTDPLHC